MCMTCGCGDLNYRPSPGDITLDDVKKAAANHDLTVETVGKNMAEAFAQVKAKGSIGTR
ncbi:MAG: hypothetical protein IT305_18835 [Chloroflexi bacterium]|nr:hypothetical protein [Chloroflexota bacterium]